ncbi:protocatechuate 3,4-dioxygenase subunit alpha [Pararobbsia alpina]|uniref:Protocatechuate 3,4-dioxygenase alpha chain n=1 Tax=Pararobbsia alpina TaxID=621374 RepID=A0A6S7CJ75_9BURK|nr:protocatechuate 3,4-dioxygenase subunit alpha [Pararobbsia alpina]CAB3791064.1 Protocatechuate 3,4-dioxygenase alpha chain [Pararobbsia alpina]
MFGTPSQTVGPYLRIGLEWLDDGDLIKQASAAEIPGRRITISGKVIDGNGILVPDAVLEFWQADANGAFPTLDAERKPTQAFRGFARICTDSNGGFTLKTIMPGATDGPNGQRQAPHIGVQVSMRGLLRPLYTRVYFPDTPANAGDPLLNAVPAARRGTLIANPTADDTFTWNVVVQSVGAYVETAFFDF